MIKSEAKPKIRASEGPLKNYQFIKVLLVVNSVSHSGTNVI